ncbi:MULTISPECIES: CHAT domain-containing protein [Calothrix]|uniref:CHAT domain-containing protein n=2 Tax=Calothrix TaxID=1186 RepID=A0ABR8A9N5_9CYAN|nr:MULTISPECIES: CHAT domain-containing tetratricopeptide repeat protein [Calothrix]MBD2195776.1 CHAT domain-containing protein [Calothrix parietina FACHB-288]MBD2224432.1 CHAT domain-containing protein [Calothrix anomala FACHB-343]
MAKGFGSQKSPDFTQRQKAYFRLIKQLLNCPHGREMKIFRKHAHLVDAGFVETLEMVAQIRFNQGDIRSAYFLRNLAHWLVEELELYRDEPSATANFIRPPAFLGEILSAIAQNKSNPQAVYSLLQANLDQLNDNFYEQFCSWINLTFISSESKKEQLSLGLLLIDFCTLLWQFPLGKRAINLEIVITGLEAVAKIFIPDVVPEIWANIQLNLAPAYRNRIRGNRADNQEKAIAACNNALLIYTRDSFLQQWATLQNNLGLVYTDRITGDKAENIEKSIACYETALKVVNRAQFSELWGSLQNNLGNAYLVRIQGDEAQNLEKAIACYQVALQVRTRSTSPYYWASSQFTLGTAYTRRILGNKQQNLERAISAYINALEVYTISDYPERWARAKSNLGNAYYEASQITEALDCLRAALQVFTPTDYPRDCIQTGLILGKTALAAGMKTEAFAGYVVAIEAVDQSRIWAGISHQQEIPEEILAYTNMVVFCITNGQRDKAREYAERSGYQHLLNLLDSNEIQQISLNSQFLEQVLQATSESNGDSQAVYQILENNLNQLDEQFVHYLQRLEDVCKEMTSGQAIQLAATTLSFSNLIREFPQGDTAINLRIAATGYEVAASVFTKKDFPEQWEQIEDASRELFQIQLFEAVFKNLDNPKAVVYPLLEANKHKLDERFATVLRLKTEAMLSEAPPEYAQDLAASLVGLSLLIKEFRQGSEANNLEIAITGYELASKVLTYEDSPEVWCLCQSMLGNAYHRRIKGEQAENLEQSLSYLHNALQVCNCEQFPELWATIQNSLVITYGYRIRGDQVENAELAIQAGEAAMQVFTYDQDPEQWAQIQNNLGLVYRDRLAGDKAENLEKAIACYQNALSIRTREDFPELWAQTQFNIGSAYRQRLRGDAAENVEMAIAANQRALQVYTKTAFPQDWAQVHINLANAYLHRIYGDRSQNLKKAIAAHQGALQVLTKEEFPRQWAMAQMNLGNVFLEQELLEEAISCYRSALKIFTPTAFPPDCLKAGQMLGNTAFNIGDWAEAIRGYSVAIEAVETSRTWASSESRRQEILADSLHVYENMVQACINNKQLNKAIEYVERSRSKRLVDLIVSNDLYSDGEIPDEIQQYLQDFEAIQRQIDNELRQHNNSSNFDGSKLGKSPQNRAAIEAHNKIIADLEADKQQIWEQMRRLDPVLAGQIQVSPMNLSSIQQLIDLPTTAILSFFTTSHDTHIFIIRQSQITLHTCTDLGFETLQESILTHWLGQYLNNQDTWKEQFSFLIAELAEVLKLNDLIAQHLKNIDELILVPHLALHQIPFAALPTGENQYLGDKFLIRYVPNCQILEFCHNRPTVSSLMNYGIVEDATEDLPYASWEGEQLANLYNIPNNQRLKGSQEASVSNYRQLIQKVQIIHSSHHARSRLDNPLESALFLGDGCITLSQLLTPSWRNPQLEDVFLSCCETGLSVTEITDDILTFSTAFLCAGAKSVISTLWAVNDLATALFSVFYYQSRHQGNKRLQSIRQAQFELRILTGETLTTIYKPKLSSFLTQKGKETDTLRKKIQKERDSHPHSSLLYEQCNEEYKKYDKIGKLIYQAKKDLELFCRESKPFSHPYYWAAFTCSGLN